MGRRRHSVMPTLVHFKRRVASRLGSGPLEAEARQRGSAPTSQQSFSRDSACTRGSAGGGLILSADLVMVPLIVWEVLEAARGRTCCAD
jgi:hypothetical protein